MAPETSFETNDPRDAAFFAALKALIDEDSRVITEGEREIRVHPGWFRDHVHEMKAWKWWESDLTSFVDRLIELQPPRGFFHEILTSPRDPHANFVDPEFVYRNEQDRAVYIRLENEADIEYLMVEAVYFIWQATGDTDAMARRLSALDRGLNYNLQDPTRWDPEHGLMKRPFTIDTWDFTWGTSTDYRGIYPDTPMAIMHGDNSGLYRACLQMSEMTAVAGDDSASAKWLETAAGIRERANELLWNGSFYTHQYHLDPVDVGCDESDMLSLSNTYDINRGLPTHNMAVSIIDEYRSRRERSPGVSADWYALDPPYPMFAVHPAGQYINGGFASFVAGELAKAALRHGREEYGVDILRRVRDVIDQTGTLRFIVGRDERDMGWGPRGWSAAAAISAMMEGLAGITERSVLFDSVEIAPRYPAAGITEAQACLHYGPSEAYVDTRYIHNTHQRTIEVQVAGTPTKIAFHILLPSGATASSVTINGEPAQFEFAKVEQSPYCDLSTTETARAETVVKVAYSQEQRRS